MLATTPTVLSQSGIVNFTLQSAETTKHWILIRIRARAQASSDGQGATVNAIRPERLALSDARGMVDLLPRSIASGEGPFAGIVDLAYPLDSGVDLAAPMTLSSESARMTFQLPGLPSTDRPRTINPVAKFRKDHGLTIADLANIRGVTEKVVRNAEQGLFNRLPPSIEEAIAFYEDAETARRIRLQYEDWLTEPLPDIELPPVGSVDTFVSWRFMIGSNINEFCRKMRLQHTIVSNYENSRTRNLPQLIEKRLRRIGADDEYISWLESLPRHSGSPWFVGK